MLCQSKWSSFHGQSSEKGNYGKITTWERFSEKQNHLKVKLRIISK